MTKIIIAISCVLLISIGSAADKARAQENETSDIIQLKDGTIINGSILGSLSESNVRIRTSDGKISNVPWTKIGNIFKGKSELKSKAAFHLKKSRHRKPEVAFLLSLAVPGAGQVYNGQPAKGAVQFGLALGGAIVVLSVNRNLSSFYYDDRNYATPIAFWGMMISIGASLWSIIDAPLGANKANQNWNFTAAPVKKQFKLGLGEIGTGRSNQFVPALTAVLRF